MFGKPKKKIELAMPRDDAEAVKVAKAVAEKYPQMSDPNWGKPKRKEAVKKQPVRRQQQSVLEGALTAEEIKKLKGE